MDTSDLLRGFSRFKSFYYSAFKPLLKKSGLSQNQVDIMLFLANNPDYDRARDVIEMRNMSKSQVSKSVEELENTGYLDKKTDENDRRNFRLKLTPSSEEIVSEAKRIQNRVFNELFKSFDATEREELQKMIAKLNKALDEAEIELN